MSQLIEMLFNSTLLIQSVFEVLRLESEISIAGCYCQQNNFCNSALGIGKLLLKTNSTCFLQGDVGLPGLTGFPGPPGRKVRVFFSSELDQYFYFKITSSNST